MAEALDIRSEYWEGENWTTVALVVSIVDNTALTQPLEVTSISCSVFDTIAPATNIYTGAAPVVSATIFNTLRTDYGWSYGDGYNFRHTIDPTASLSAFQGGHTYKIEYVLTGGEGKYAVVHWASVRPMAAV